MAPHPTSPLLTSTEIGQIRRAHDAGFDSVKLSLDLQRSLSSVHLGSGEWRWDGRSFPYPDRCKERTIYHWTDGQFEAVARYRDALIKLVPTEWGAPTFEIDGIKMLPTAQVSPYIDAQLKVALIRPRGKVILDCCGGLGYFAAWCLEGQAASILSYEKNADVLWLRDLNPWSPPADPRLHVVAGDVTVEIGSMAAASVDAVLHDPPRFGIAGELYSQGFYLELARVTKRNGRLFHYTGSPNRISGGRDLAGEVAGRLRVAGFDPARSGDGVLAVRR